MDQQLGDAEPGYVSCMFCTARCFKLHGTSQGGCAAASTSSREMVLNQPGASKEKSSGRKHRAPFFVKTVKITTVRRKNCELHLPAFFFKDYGDRFQKFVLLQGPSGQVWPVNLCVSCGSTTGRPTVRFSRGWKEFANDHRLELGDKLIFTLASFSRFSVQVFDPLGRKKPTSSTAVSGWSFRREDDEKDEPGNPRPQKKSIFVNWQNKVVRESSPGSSVKDGKGQASRVAMLCRHLRRENKTPEKRSSSLVARLRGQSLPLSLLGQKWSDRDQVLDDTQADDAMNLLEWEPLETASPSQLWPLALKSNQSSKALDSGPNVLSITSNPSSPPREGDQEDDDEEDSYQAYWKLHSKRSAIYEVAPAETPQILNVRPISALEAPKAIDTPPSPALISISHCLAPVSCLEADPQPRNVQSSVSQELLGFPNSSLKQESVRSEKLSQRSRISDTEVREAEKNIPSNVQSSVSQELLGFPNSSLRQESARTEKLSHRNRLSEEEKSIPSNLQSSVTQELLGFANSAKQASVRIDKLSQRNLAEAASIEAEIIDRAPPSRSELEIKTPSRSFANPTPSRSDVSLAYFLHQPRPTAQKHEDGVSGDRSRPHKPHPVSAQKLQAPDTRIKPHVRCPSLAASKENIPPGPLVVYNSPLKLDQVTLPCKRSGTSMEKKARPLISDCTRGLSQAGNLDVSSSRRDMAAKFQLDSSSKKRSLEVSSGVLMSEDLKARRLRGALNLLGKGSTPQTKIGNRCDLVELDDIASDDGGSDS